MESSASLGPSASFRESDAEFLQTEAREWLEAVLEEKLDAETSLQDLLADGTILYRISQIIKEQLSKIKGGSHTTEVHLPNLSSPDMNRRSTSLKYQPYSYVEAFLKVCKDVGLLDLDLFNPSDAVDKKDIRHVCICLRRLSKQARTLNVQLPEFDNVKHALSYKHAVEAGPHDSLHKTPSRFKNENKETSPSIQDPNDETGLESDVVVDGNPSRVPMEVTTLTSADTDFRSMETTFDLTTASRSEDTDVSLESDVVVDENAGREPMEVTVSTSADTDFRSLETTFSSSEDLTTADTYLEVVQTSVSDESGLPGPGAQSEKLHVNGLDLTGCRGDGRSPPALKLRGTKEKRIKRKGWWPWFPYAAGAAVVVGAVVVLVASKEKRQITSPGEETLAEIAGQTQKS